MPDSLILTKELVPSRGFQSSVDYKLIIGLGKIDHVDSMIITWPDRSLTRILNPSINKTDTIREREDRNSAGFVNPTTTTQETFFLPEKAQFDKHQENNVIDFYIERNIPAYYQGKGQRQQWAM